VKVGDLVRMIDEPHKIVGVIIKRLIDNDHNKVYYKVAWLDYRCDPSYADEDVLEVISESR